MDAVQLFAQSPRTWRFPEHDPADLEAFKRAARGARHRRGLCPRPLPAEPREPRRRALREERRDARAPRWTRPARSRPTASSSTSARTWAAASRPGLERVVPALRAGTRALLRRRPGSAWRTRPAPAARSAARSRSSPPCTRRSTGHERLGVCLDSCHLYVSGYDVTDPAELDRVVDELDELIGLDRLRCLHVNDSKAPLGSNRDRHDEHRRGPDRREARRLPRPPEAAGPPGAARGARARRPRARRGADEEAARALHARATRARVGAKHAERRLADRQLGELRVDAPELAPPGCS